MTSSMTRACRAAVVAGALWTAPTGVASQDPVATGPDRPPPVAFLSDVAVDAGWPVSYIQTVRLVRLGVEVTPSQSVVGGWRVEYPLTLYPVVWARNVARTAREGESRPRTNAWGFTAHPAAVRLVRPTRGAELLVGSAVGVSRFGRDTPTAMGSRWNFSIDLEVGARIVLSPTRHLIVGYQFNHLSNARSSYANPGLDSHMIRMGIRGR